MDCLSCLRFFIEEEGIVPANGSYKKLLRILEKNFVIIVIEMVLVTI